MTASNPFVRAYILAARRSVLGRIGGLHRQRRLEDLCAPVISAALSDARVAVERVEGMLLGNTTQGGNPARSVALASGVAETAPAMTLDRQGASGLDAIIAACRAVAAGDSSVLIAGGADSPSTAPWRLARSRSGFQPPSFVTFEPPVPLDATEAMARRLGISRARQDAYALRSHVQARAWRDARRHLGEIVPLRANAEEGRDQSAVDPSISDLEDLPALIEPGGTVTAATCVAPHDGCGFAVIVSHDVWTGLGKPPALVLMSDRAIGVSAASEALAPVAAMQALAARDAGASAAELDVVEMSESSAAQAIAFADELGVDPDLVNPAGGEIVRGHPLGASGAVLMVRLFHDVVRGATTGKSRRQGAVAIGAAGGIGVAAAFRLAE